MSSILTSATKIEMETEMADFLDAYARTLDNEGGWSNTPGDRGGKTWFGITQKWWPKWYAMLEQATNDRDRAIIARQFYMKEFWEKINGDGFKSQELAYQVFDHCVNAGLDAGKKLFQVSLNIWCQGELLVDGVIGPKTLAVAHTMPDAALQGFRSERVMVYRQMALYKETQRQFMPSWMRRV